MPTIRGLAPITLTSVTTLSILLTGAASQALAATSLPEAAAARAHTMPELAAALQAATARRAALARAGGALDTTPPELRRFALGGSVDVQQQGAAAIADMSITDDLSGVQMVFLTLHSPTGAQSAIRNDLLSSGARKFAGKFAVGAQMMTQGGGYFTRFSEPGTWTADTVFVFDVNSNVKAYFAEDLTAFGPATVNVVNQGGYDVTPPTVDAARLALHKLSLSKPPPGAAPGTLPFLRGELDVSDTGNGAVAGAYKASISLCLPDDWSGCLDTMELDGTADAPDLAKAKIRMSAQPRADQTPGTYYVYQVFAMDIAGNSVVVTTGIPRLFPDGYSIEVRP